MPPGDREVQLVRAHVVERAVVELVRGQLRERRNVELDTGPRFAATCVECTQLVIDPCHMALATHAIPIVESAQVGARRSRMQRSAPCARGHGGAVPGALPSSAGSVARDVVDSTLAAAWDPA